MLISVPRRVRRRRRVIPLVREACPITRTKRPGIWPPGPGRSGRRTHKHCSRALAHGRAIGKTRSYAVSPVCACVRVYADSLGNRRGQAREARDEPDRPWLCRLMSCRSRMRFSYWRQGGWRAGLDRLCVHSVRCRPGGWDGVWDVRDRRDNLESRADPVRAWRLLVLVLVLVLVPSGSREPAAKRKINVERRTGHISAFDVRNVNSRPENKNECLTN